MVLTNYWKMLQAIGTATSDGWTMIPVITTDGNTYNICVRAESKQFLNHLKGVVGGGTTAPQKDDYRLAYPYDSNIISNLRYNYTTGYDADGLKIFMTISGTNISGSTINITEAGITFETYNNYGVSEGSVLATRTILDSPITVPHNSGFIVTLEWLQA